MPPRADFDWKMKRLDGEAEKSRPGFDRKIAATNFRQSFRRDSEPVAMQYNALIENRAGFSRDSAMRSASGRVA
jgi:hypothetical protein